MKLINYIGVIYCFMRVVSVINADNILLSNLFKNHNNFNAYDGSNPFEIFKDKYSLQGVKQVFKEYDFIVIGAGSAGSIVANRLSENSSWTVLLLEAGDTESVITDIPILAGILEGSGYTWQYKMETEPNTCLAFENHVCPMTVGKAIGGSSVINYMIYTRGTKRDWDTISKAGNKGWSYEEVLPYFIKTERTNIKSTNSSARGKRGPMNVEYIKYRTEYANMFLEASKELGNNIVDYNTGEIGFNYVQSNTLNGRRISTSKAFLYPFRHRENLHILPKSKVTKINIDQHTKVASSVEFARNKILYKVNARKEIIVTAGALSTPQILMLSGIGPKQHLNEVGIPLIQDLSVGENLRDHLAFGGMTIVTDEPEISQVHERMKHFGDMLQWIKNGQGMLTIPGGIEAIGFINTNITTSDRDYADAELALFSLPVNFADDIVKSVLKISDEFYERVYSGLGNRRSFAIIPIILNTEARGWVRLKDANPFHWPKFIGNLYSAERDLETFVAAVRYVQKLVAAKSFSGKIRTDLYRSHYPTCKRHLYDTDGYWKCAIRSLSFSLHHHVGTCKMGPDSDASSVVDSELKVKGIRNLRVADASVIPFPLAAHPAAPVMMIAEKASDLIKTHWNNK